MNPTVPPIRDLAVIGDTRTAALVDLNGAVRWLCLPRFDSEPVFDGLLDPDRGGRFSIQVDSPIESRRRYQQDSAVLVTEWRTGAGRAQLEEGMVTDIQGSLLPDALLVRHLACTAGEVGVEVVYDPRLGPPHRELRQKKIGNALVATTASSALALCASRRLDWKLGEPMRLELTKGDRITFALSYAHKSPLVMISPDSALDHLRRTDRWWREWTSTLNAGDLDPDQVRRSLITLRMLCYSPSGAPVAAPTTSLPETVGGQRNWDYRYSWPRDASLAITAFLGAGMPDSADQFARWLLHAARISRPAINVMYSVDGRPPPKEREVDLPGYLGSSPVRVGNEAFDQKQLDVYGWVINAIKELAAAGHPIPGEGRRMVRRAADLVSREWSQPDNGIWEIRGERKQYVHSKMMGWIALESAADLETLTGRAPGRRLQDWRNAQVGIRRAVEEHGMVGGQFYKRAFDQTQVDASVLWPLTYFEQDAAIAKQTIAQIRRELAASGPLLYRYRPDRTEGEEGAFVACSFWLAHALSRLGDLDGAVSTFEGVTRLANDVGLWSEEVDPQTGSFLGNFPQALTHAAMVLAAQEIEKAMADSKRSRESGRRQGGQLAS